METYVGHRYVPKIMGVWNKLLTYENLSIVTYDNSSYTSKTIVPVGFDISNEKYWIKTGDYNAQVEEFKNDFTAQLAQTKTYLNDLGINVKTLGAKGDGVTDDTVFIQMAIDKAIQAGGGTVYFPAGVYVIQPTSVPTEGGALTITGDSISLIGESVGNTKLLYKALNGEEPTDSENLTGAIYLKSPTNTGIHNFEMRNIEIDGNVTDAYTASRNLKHKGLFFANNGGASSNVRIYDCIIRNFRAEMLYNGGYNSGLLIARDTTFEQSSGSIATWGGSPEYYNCRFMYGKDAGVEQSVPPNGRLVVKDCYFKNACGPNGTQLAVVPQNTSDNTNISCEIENNYFEHDQGLQHFTGISIISFGRSVVRGNKFKDAGKGLNNGHACVRVLNILSNYTTFINDNVTIENNEVISDKDDTNFIYIGDAKPDDKLYAVNMLSVRNNKIYTTEKATSLTKKATYTTSLNATIKEMIIEGNVFSDYRKQNVQVPQSMTNVSTINTLGGFKEIRVKLNMPENGSVKVEVMQTVNSVNEFQTVVDLTDAKDKQIVINTFHVPNTGGAVYIRAVSNVVGATLNYEIRDI